jgi:hypothetical protein
LEVCRLLQPINHPEDGGPLTDGPPYDCSRKATAAPTANSYKFDVSGMAADKVLAVAILPTQPTDRVVFSPPDDSSLATQGGSTADTGSGVSDTGPAGASDSVPALGSDIAGSSSAPVGGGLSSDSTPSVAVGDSTIATPSPGVSPTGPANNLPFVPAATAAPEKATPIAVILLVLGTIGGGLLWAFAGRQRARPALP